jgi:uncharacterized protein involved in exopolysaccharide biosynthesis
MEKENKIIEDEQSFEDLVKKFKPYFKKIKNNFKKLFIVNSVVAIIAIVLLLIFGKPYFTSCITILPDYGNSSVMGNISGLAAMAGINVGEPVSTEIYEKLLYSESVIKDVVNQKYVTEKYSESINLVDYFEIESTDVQLSSELQERSRFLQIKESLTESRIKTEIDRMTRALSISVTMPEAKLSSDVVNQLVKSLNKYITLDRQSTAREQSQYLKNRLIQVKDSLNMFENELLIFTEKNISITTSPRLLLEEIRLKRRVEIAQELFLSLTTQYELIKLEEVKETPVLNIMEKAEQPIKKSGPKRLNILIIIMLFSISSSLIYFLYKDRITKYIRIINS